MGSSCPPHDAPADKGKPKPRRQNICVSQRLRGYPRQPLGNLQVKPYCTPPRPNRAPTHSQGLLSATQQPEPENALAEPNRTPRAPTRKPGNFNGSGGCPTGRAADGDVKILSEMRIQVRESSLPAGAARSCYGACPGQVLCVQLLTALNYFLRSRGSP